MFVYRRGMDACTHSGPDSITTARVTGVVQRYAVRLANPANGHARAEDGVAELRARTTDPHLLAHGIPASDDWYHDAAYDLLLAAGADPDDIARIRAEIDRRRAAPDLLAQLANNVNANRAERHVPRAASPCP